MRQVLIVSPHFPPGDTVDMHRVRMTAPHYASNGWRPVVLKVAAGDTGRRIDEGLLATLPPDLEVHEVAAPQTRLAAAAGLNAVGLRAWSALDRAGRRLLSERAFDLVFISTTEFPVMALGRAWKRRFGVPFVLDFQDPWATFPASATPYLRSSFKHRMMRSIHKLLESWTLPDADGLISVSASYVDLLREVYPVLRGRPALVSPFPYSAADFAIATERGRSVAGLTRTDGDLTCLYAGRVAPAQEPSLRACLAVVAAGRRRRPELFDRLRFVFVGTGYAQKGNPSVAGRLAIETGMNDRVVEYSDRIGFLDAQKSMLDAGLLLIIGSDDDGYTPSKLNQSLSLAKPVLCAAPRASPAAKAVADLASVIAVFADEPETDLVIDALAARLESLIAGGSPTAYADRDAHTAPFEAAMAAKRDCAFFDDVLQAARSPGGWSEPHDR